MKCNAKKCENHRSKGCEIGHKDHEKCLTWKYLNGLRHEVPQDIERSVRQMIGLDHSPREKYEPKEVQQMRRMRRGKR